MENKFSFVSELLSLLNKWRQQGSTTALIDILKSRGGVLITDTLEQKYVLLQQLGQKYKEDIVSFRDVSKLLRKNPSGPILFDAYAVFGILREFNMLKNKFNLVQKALITNNFKSAKNIAFDYSSNQIDELLSTIFQKNNQKNNDFNEGIVRDIDCRCENCKQYAD